MKKYKIEDDHSVDCQYMGDGDWRCGTEHKTREKIYYLNQRITTLENVLKERAEWCSNELCRAKCRDVLEK